MYVSLICVGFPFRMIMTNVYSRLTNTEYKFKTEDLFDFVIFALIVWWIYLWQTFQKHEATNPKIASTPQEIFMYDML
jgi:hypothetical protein